jgi:hypothetical protein
MNSFLISDNCPNLLKADVEKAKQNFNLDNLYDPVGNQFENEMSQQPDWMELIKPNPNYEEIDNSYDQSKKYYIFCYQKLSSNLENEEFTWYDNNFHLKARLLEYFLL